MAEDKPRNETRIALIGAIATIAAAVITGIFGLIQLTSRAQAPPPPTDPPVLPTATSTQLSIPTQTFTPPPPTATPTLVPTDAPTATPAPGLLFATRIAADGRALDPGATFEADITDLYAVFLANAAPPGLAVDVEDPVEGAYYAYLKVKEEATLAAFGWRWILDGAVVAEYLTDVEPGVGVWLQRFDYGGSGMFSGDPLGPGTYTVVILLGGNPALSGEFTILP